MGNLSHINSMKKANAVVESVETLWKEGKTLKDYESFYKSCVKLLG